MTLGQIDLILVLIAAELLVLGLWLARKGQLRLLAPLACFLLSGAALMVALRAALSPDTSTLAVAIGLIASLFLHLATLVLAWRAVRERRPREG